jgi:hypothetical protein
VLRKPFADVDRVAANDIKAQIINALNISLMVDQGPN